MEDPCLGPWAGWPAIVVAYELIWAQVKGRLREALCLSIRSMVSVDTRNAYLSEIWTMQSLVQIRVDLQYLKQNIVLKT